MPLGVCSRCETVVEPMLSESVVRARQASRARMASRSRARLRGGARAHEVPSEVLGEHLFQLDGEYPRLVHLAPTLVGPSHPRILVRPLRRCSTIVARAPGGLPEVRRRRLAPGRGRARYLVLLGAVAVFDARMARTRRPSSRRYYPTSLLVTGFDIIFFWVARMMMMGLEGARAPH